MTPVINRETMVPLDEFITQEKGQAEVFVDFISRHF